MHLQCEAPVHVEREQRRRGNHRDEVPPTHRQQRHRNRRTKGVVADFVALRVVRIDAARPGTPPPANSPGEAEAQLRAGGAVAKGVECRWAAAPSGRDPECKRAVCAHRELTEGQVLAGADGDALRSVVEHGVVDELGLADGVDAQVDMCRRGRRAAHCPAMHVRVADKVRRLLGG